MLVCLALRGVLMRTDLRQLIRQIGRMIDRQCWTKHRETTDRIFQEYPICLMWGTWLHALWKPSIPPCRSLQLLVSRKPICRQIRSRRLPFYLSYPGNLRRGDPVDGLSGCIRLRADRSYLPSSLNPFFYCRVSQSLPGSSIANRSMQLVIKTGIR